MALIKSRKFIRRRRTTKLVGTAPSKITTTKIGYSPSLQGPTGTSSFVIPGVESKRSVTIRESSGSLREVPTITTVRGAGVDVRGTAAGVVRGVGSTGVNILGSMLGAGIRRLKGIRWPDSMIDPNMRFLYLGSSRISPTGRRHEAFELHFGRNWRERMLR